MALCSDISPSFQKVIPIKTAVEKNDNHNIPRGVRFIKFAARFPPGNGRPGSNGRSGIARKRKKERMSLDIRERTVYY
jgi:hypothetical protein